MGGEDRLDPQAGQQPADLADPHAGAAQAGGGLHQAAALRHAAPLVVAAAADAVHLLGQVDDLEVGGEGARQLRRRRRLEPAQPPPETGVAVVALAAGDGGAPHGLDPLEQPAAALLGEHLADQLAEPADVVAERLVLGGELDAALGHRRSRPARRSA